MRAFLDAISSGDDALAGAAVEALASLTTDQQEQVLLALEGLLESPQEDTRWWATRSLAALTCPGVASRLLRQLRDNDAGVRYCALLGLRLHPASQALPELVLALDSQDSLLAALAGDALVANSTAAVPALLGVMQEGSQLARLEAVRALAEIGDTRAIPVLFAGLNEGSALIEHWASQGLEKMGVGMVYFKPG